MQSPSNILKSLRTLFVFPRGNILIVDHVCTTRLHQLPGSMKHSTIHLPTESGMLWPGCLFVGIGHFDNSSNTDHLMKNSEHPFLQTILNLTLERRQSSDSWMLVSLVPDLELSDLEKSQSSQKSNGDNLSLRCLILYHKCSEYLYSAFKDPSQYFDLWVHCIGFGWMHVYFQVGMIIGDTEQHNKQYMWLPWMKWLT